MTNRLQSIIQDVMKTLLDELARPLGKAIGTAISDAYAQGYMDGAGLNKDGNFDYSNATIISPDWADNKDKED